MEQRPGDQHSADQHSGNADQDRDPAAFGTLFFAGVQQHDGNYEQNHDRAGVDDHLHSSNKFRA